MTTLIQSSKLEGAYQGKRSRAFRAVEAILREDPVLVSIVKTWATWDGGTENTMAPAVSMMPMIRLSPAPLANQPFSQGLVSAYLGIAVEVMVPGLNAESIMDAWDAVEDAVIGLKPFRGTTVQCYLDQQVGGARYECRYPGIGAFADKRGVNFLAGEGQIIVGFLRNR